MQYKKIGGKMIARIDKGEDIIEQLKKLCEQEKNSAGIGQRDRRAFRGADRLL